MLPSDIEDRPGVYQIVNKRTGKRYIGSSDNVRSRLRGHLRDLEKGCHSNTPLQTEWNTDSFFFGVIRYCEDYVGMEQQQLDLFHDTGRWGRLYNILKGAVGGPSVDGPINDRKWLKNKYVKQSLLPREIALEIGCCASTVRNRLRGFDIPLRTDIPDDALFYDEDWLRKQIQDLGLTSEQIAEKADCASATIIRNAKALGITWPEPKHRDKDWLKEQYTDKCLFLQDIADMVDCDSGTIRRWVDRYDLRRGYDDRGRLKTKIDNQRMSLSALADHFNCSRHTIKKQLDKFELEIKPPFHQDQEWLHQKKEQGLSLDATADEAQCSVGTVRRWLKNFDLG